MNLTNELNFMSELYPYSFEQFYLLKNGKIKYCLEFWGKFDYDLILNEVII